MKLLSSVLLLAYSLHAGADELAMLTESTRAQVLPLLPKVAAMMKHTVQQEGTAAAIPVCKDKAPALIDAKSRELGWQMRRVSLKPRNPDRATADAWEMRQLADFDVRAASGEAVRPMEVGEVVTGDDGKRSFRYMKAIPVGAVCLQCHGATEGLAPELSAAIAKSYPEDRATGYRLGQIRGALSVRRPL